MFGSTILDVAVGLVFVYCLYSLLATTINEIISSILALRAKKLELAIRRMLTDDASIRSDLSNRLLDQFFAHPLIRYMNAGSWFNRAPSYIAAQDFSKIVVDSLRTVSDGAGLLSPESITAGLRALDPGSNSDTVRLLQSFLQDANNDMEKFRALLEQWFNRMMERTSGWYTRQAKWIALLIGLGVAAAFNASTFTIAGNLMKDKSAREDLAQMASSYLQSHPQSFRSDSAAVKPDSTTSIDSLVNYAANLYKTDIRQSNKMLGLGWSGNAAANHMDQRQWLLNVLGWLVTALAISLGAPFWFDLLSKLVQLRGTGPKPAEETPAVTEEIAVLKRKG